MLSHPGKNRVNINSPFGPSATQPGSGGRNPSLDSFVEAKRRGDLEKMRHSVNEWHFVVYQLERETTGLFSHLISSQGFSGVIWDLLINRLFNGVGISWG